MLKFLIVMVLVIYLMWKIGQFLFKVLIIGAGGQAAYRQQQEYRKHQASAKHQNNKENISIDYIPENGKHGGTDHFKGGEYVDYEEVK